MNNPQYIVLSIAQIITVGRDGKAQMKILQPPPRKLFPLPMMITCEQNAAPGKARVEIEMPDHIFRCEQLFDDAVAAISRAYDEDVAVARCPDRTAIEAAGARAILDTTMGEEATEKALQAAKEAGAVRWDEAMPMVGFPHKEPKAGDLALRAAAGGEGWHVRIFIVNDDKSWEWGVDGLPRELQRVFSTQNEARLAVRTAGYGRRLIEE